MTDSFKNIPKNFLIKWQNIADLLAKIIEVPAALIMKNDNEYMEVVISSKSDNNPYHPGDKEHWHGLYCETVIKTQKELLVPDALKDENWEKNPDIKLGMIAYLGIPINFPDKQPFGTLCVLDKKENRFSAENKALLYQFKNVIELDLALIQSFDWKNCKDDVDIVYKLQEQNEEYLAINEELKQSNNQLSKEKKKVEESEERFRNIYHDNLAAMLILEPETRKIVEVNNAALKFYGYPREQMLSMKIDDINTLSAEELKTEMGKAVKQHRVYYQFKHRLASGEIRDVEVYSSKIQINNKLHFCSLVHDITERKLAEQQLKKQTEEYYSLYEEYKTQNEELFEAKERIEKSEEKFRKAILTSPDAITINRLKDGVYISANDGFYKTFEYSEKDIIGISSLEINIWHQIEKRKIYKDSLEKTGEIKNFETKFITKTGKILDCLVSSAVILLDGEKHTINITKDISAIKKIKNELIISKEKAEENEEKFRSLFNSTLQL